MTDFPVIIRSDTVDAWNPANHLRWVVYPIIYRVFYIPGGAGFLPSTVPCTHAKMCKLMWKSPECFWVQGIQILLPTIPLGREAPEPQNWSSKQSWLSGRALVNLLVWSSTKVHSTYPKEFQPKPISVAITRASKRNIISTPNPSWFKRSIFREISVVELVKVGEICESLTIPLFTYP